MPDWFKFAADEVRRIARSVRGAEQTPVARSGQRPSPQPAPPTRRTTEVYVTSATAVAGLYPGVQVARVQAAYSDPQAPIASTAYPPGYVVPGAAVGGYQPYGGGAADCWISVPPGTAPTVGDVYVGILSALNSDGLPIYTATAPGSGGSVSPGSITPGAATQVLATTAFGVEWSGGLFATASNMTLASAGLHGTTVYVTGGSPDIQLPSATSVGPGCVVRIANWNSAGVTTLKAFNSGGAGGETFFQTGWDPAVAGDIVPAGGPSGGVWTMKGGELVTLISITPAVSGAAAGWVLVQHFDPAANNLRGFAVSGSTPTAGQVLTFNGTQWQAQIPYSPTWTSYTLQAGVDFTAAATTQTVTVMTLNPKGAVHGYIIDVTQAFLGPGGNTQVTLSLGESASGITSSIVNASPIGAASADPPTAFSFATAKLGKVAIATNVTATITCSGFNVSQLTQGTVVVKLLTSQMP